MGIVIKLVGVEVILCPFSRTIILGLPLGPMTYSARGLLP